MNTLHGAGCVIDGKTLSAASRSERFVRHRAQPGAEFLGVAPVNPVALRLRIGEQHPQDVRRHQHQHEHRYDLYRHVLLLPLRAVFDPNRSAGIAGTISRRRIRRWD